MFIQDMEKQHQLLDIVFTVMDNEFSRDADRIRGLQLIESILLNMRGSVDAVTVHLVTFFLVDS